MVEVAFAKSFDKERRVLSVENFNFECSNIYIYPVSSHIYSALTKYPLCLKFVGLTVTTSN